jgi:hypothetical protein
MNTNKKTLPCGIGIVFFSILAMALLYLVVASNGLFDSEFVEKFTPIVLRYHPDLVQNFATIFGIGMLLLLSFGSFQEMKIRMGVK